jgi:hypothetical protein
MKIECINKTERPIYEFSVSHHGFATVLYPFRGIGEIPQSSKEVYGSSCLLKFKIRTEEILLNKV